LKLFNIFYIIFIYSTNNKNLTVITKDQGRHTSHIHRTTT